MKITRYLAAGTAIVAAAGIAWGAGMFSTLPIVGQPAFCGSIIGAGPVQSGLTGTGAGTTITGSTICGQTIPAGPAQLTGNELIPADTGLVSGPTQTVTIPSGMITGTGGPNVLVGGDFGQNLWQRGLPPISAVALGQATYGPDGWYAFTSANSQTVTVSKQTGAADVFPATTASARFQRVASQTGTAVQSFGQLVPNDNSQRFPGNTAIFSCNMLAGANFTPASNQVNMIIAAHTAADSTTAGANGQGTNTATFASSTGTTQNITGYTELVNTPTTISTTWTRYSVAAAVPTTISGNNVTGIGVKVTWTPSGTAGTNDFVEFANCQLEARAGSSVGPSAFQRRNLIEEQQLEYARFWQINEAASGGITPIYGFGEVSQTNVEFVQFNYPAAMRITPVTSPITQGSFGLNVAGVATSATGLTAVSGGNTTLIGSIRSTGTAATVGQIVQFIGGALGTGKLGFSAEP